jgi:ubiquinone/menaquinone biosynthesis C-methylase UbiE
MDESGERIIEKNVWNNEREYLMYLRHLKAYQFSRKFLKNEVVLEVGCGDAYGLKHISDSPNKIFASDIFFDSLHKAKAKRYSANIFFINADTINLPFRSEVFDIVLSFQVIEHLKDIDRFFLEIKRVLKNDGLLLVSTLNRSFGKLPFQKNYNIFHHKEYTVKEFLAVLHATFEDVKVLGLRGDREVEEIIKSIWRENPLILYASYVLPLPIKKLIKKLLARFGIRKIGNKRTSKGHSQNITIDQRFLHRYSTDNFFITKCQLHCCMDMIGICHIRR